MYFLTFVTVFEKFPKIVRDFYFTYMYIDAPPVVVTLQGPHFRTKFERIPFPKGYKKVVSKNYINSKNNIEVMLIT